MWCTQLVTMLLTYDEISKEKAWRDISVHKDYNIYSRIIVILPSSLCWGAIPFIFMGHTDDLNMISLILIIILIIAIIVNALYNTWSVYIHALTATTSPVADSPVPYRIFKLVEFISPISNSLDSWSNPWIKYNRKVLYYILLITTSISLSNTPATPHPTEMVDASLNDTNHYYKASDSGPSVSIERCVGMIHISPPQHRPPGRWQDFFPPLPSPPASASSAPTPTYPGHHSDLSLLVSSHCNISPPWGGAGVVLWC